ncbi:MAG: hypothetical protein ABFR95_04305 [Actinomycetota bacterium]
MLVKRTFVIAATIAVILGGCAFPQQGTDTPERIGGDYYVNGVDALGKEYSGQMTVVPTDGQDTVEIQWIITGVVQTGQGTVAGTTLTADWQTITLSNGSTGTITYELQSDGTLIGERTFDDREGTGTEEAFPVDLSG